MRKIDLTGNIFGRWIVLAPSGRRYQPMWLCRCSCGVEREVSGANLRTGKSMSCGCFREENRPNLATGRDFTGIKNPRARKNAKQTGGVWMPSSNIWYRRAASIFYAAKKKHIPLGFTSVAELALYVRDIAPEKCPVFGVAFTSRGNGFSSWSPSIDKIDPTKGYVRGNIQVVSMLANCMKRDASPEQLRTFARWVLGIEK